YTLFNCVILFFFLLILRPPSSTLFPYTTLFRSLRLRLMGQRNYRNGFELTLHPHALELPLTWKKPQRIFVNSMSDLFHKDVRMRSEEHTSELQSRENLVCRLLLEKKKKKTKNRI